MATSTTLTPPVRPFVAGRTPTKSKVTVTPPVKLSVATTLPTEPPFAATSQAPRTSNTQHLTRLSYSQRYRLGSTKIINGPKAQPSPRQGLEAPTYGLQSNLNTSSIQPQNQRLSNLKTSKSSEQIETNLSQNCKKSFSQRCSMNSYGSRYQKNAISSQNQVTARFNGHSGGQDVRNTLQTASNHSTSFLEDNNGKSASEAYLHSKLPSTMYKTAIEASKAKNLKATEIKTFDLKENMRATENSKKTVKSSQQNGAILPIQRHSFQVNAMKETRGCENDQENNKDIFIQDEFENNSKCFNFSNGVQREFLRSCRKGEQSLFQECSREVDSPDSREFYSIEEYEDILEPEKHKSIVNWAKNCTLGAIIEEQEGIEYNNYSGSDLNSGMETVNTNRDRREESNYGTDARGRNKKDIKWAKTINKGEESGIGIGMNTRSEFLGNAKQNFPSKTGAGKLKQNEGRIFSTSFKSYVTDGRNTENNPGFLRKGVKCSNLKPSGKQFLKVGVTERLMEKNDHLNDDTNVRTQSTKLSDASETKIKSIQKHLVTGAFSDSIGKKRDENVREDLTNGGKKSISSKRKPLRTPIRIETTQNFGKKDVSYRESGVDSKLFSNIDIPKQAKKDENAFAMDEVTNSSEDSDNISRSSFELSLTSGSGSLSSEQSNEISNEFENAAATAISALSKNDEAVMPEYHSLRDGPDSSKEEKEDKGAEKEDLNDLCSSASSDSLLDEFLSRSSKLRIASLQKKLRAQDAALNLLKKANQQLAEEKQERQRRLQESEAEQRRTAAQLRQAKRAASAAEQRRAAADEQAKLQLKKYQDLTTEMSANRRSSASHNPADPATVRRLQNSLAAAAADKQRLHLQAQTLQREASSAAAEHQQQLSQLRLQVRQLQLLIQKQRQLIAVLQKQKISILAAKATECVERRLNSIVNDKK